MAQLKKTFCVCMFGEPFSWIHEFIDHVQHLEKYGWYWNIFTPHDLLDTNTTDMGNTGNVSIIPMNCEQFNDLVERKLGVRPNFFITEKGVPSVHITDYYVASGIIFEDYLKGSDFWGIANLDIVFGRLNHFFPDSNLNTIDIFTDDTQSFNGIFSLIRNKPYFNELFKQIPNWKEKFAQLPCKRCMGDDVPHTLFGTDEYDMSELLSQNDALIRYAQPLYYPMHSHDRLEQHVPTPKLEIKEDGSLWELSKDVNGPQWIHARPFIGREIPYFHFQRSKQWPL